MKLLVTTGGLVPADQWLDAFRAALPDCQVDPWTPGLPADYEMLLAWDPPSQLFKEQPRLKYIFNLGAGVEKLLELDLPERVQILRLQDAGMAVQMAEYVCHAAIRFFREFDHYDRQQQQRLWHRRSLQQRTAFPVGIMGLGVLGSRVVEALRPFEFPLNGWSRSRRDLAGVRCFAGAGELGDFLAATRILVCLLPLTPRTRDIVNADHLRQLQPGGCLINIARGGLVVERDLRAALDSGQLAAAVLDVMQEEPLPADHWLWQHPAVTLTPHVAGMTMQDDTVDQVVAAVRAIRQGDTPPGVVDRARGY